MRAAGARRARSGIFFHGSISFAETLPTRYRTPMGGFAKCVLLTRQAGRDPDPERHYQNIYIDANYILKKMLKSLDLYIYLALNFNFQFQPHVAVQCVIPNNFFVNPVNTVNL